jgi:hypothetical protein
LNSFVGGFNEIRKKDKKITKDEISSFVIEILEIRFSLYMGLIKLLK